MFIFISKSMLAVAQSVTLVQQQIHQGWWAPWPPVASQKGQKSLFILWPEVSKSTEKRQTTVIQRLE